MTDQVRSHYYDRNDLVEIISAAFHEAGRNVNELRPADLASIDEFHIRGRGATLELAERMNLDKDSRVLDIGSGLGGPARTLAESYGCHVTGLDLTPAFCETAQAMSDWVGLGDRVSFRQGDATALPFADDEFDAAMTIHAAMNIADKDRMYAEAKRVVKPNGVFVAYDVVQGEGGEVLFPVPWARDPSISHLATPDDMTALLANAGFEILEVDDSTAKSLEWFKAMMARMAEAGGPPVTFRAFLGDDFPAMAKNQVDNLRDARIRTMTYICRA